MNPISLPHTPLDIMIYLLHSLNLSGNFIIGLDQIDMPTFRH